MKKFLITLFIILIFPVMTFAKSNRTINVAFTIDNNYPIHTLLVIHSILVNNISGANYHFYIVENNLTDKNKKKMQKYLAKMTKGKFFDTKMDFINIDTLRIDRGQNLFAYLDYITPIAMARIFLPEILDEDRVLYLDSDILVTSDLSDLYNVKLGNNVVGMALNLVDEQYPELYKFKNGYYNSGVILMDLNKCRKMKMTDKMLSYLDKNFDKFIYKDANEKKFLYPDQDLINIVLDGRIKRLEQKWNNQTIRGKSMLKSKDANGSIYHFIGPTKPWAFDRRYTLAEKSYMKYWSNSLLSGYKYYYITLKYMKNYTKILKRKTDRYLAFFSNVIHLSRGTDPFVLFVPVDKNADAYYVGE